MTIRQYAKKVGFEIIGKLTRYSFSDCVCVRHPGERIYVDEAGNEFYISKKGICIVTAYGAVI